MFTGLVEGTGSVEAILAEPPGKKLLINVGKVAAHVQLGDSIAINGCCLTVVQRERSIVAFEAGAETLFRTTLGDLSQGESVNFERSLMVGDRLGGHFVTGHIDGVGELAARQDDENWSTFWITSPANLTSQMASKGSVAVDGVSLTLVDVDCEKFSVALIPHTLSATTLGDLRVGGRVNLETDILAKYVERQLAERTP